LTLCRAGKIVSSLKLSTIALQVRGTTYKVGGIGAVYTQLACRNMGHASALMEASIELAKSEKFQGLLLFSDIDCGFYSRFGFEEIGSADLLIHLPSLKSKPALPPHIKVENDVTMSIEIEGKQFDLHSEKFLPHHLDYTTRHYRQWLRRQPYGIDRDRQYFSYKLMRETFLHNHSRLAWPALSIMTAKTKDNFVGYAITESAGGVLRILEIVAEQSAREALWAAILVRSLNGKLMRIRAWEGLAADFAPAFNLKQLIKVAGLDEIFPAGFKGQLNYYDRTWGKGMLLSFDNKLDELHMTAPCPLVELDHL
jgi:predicted acetyltransferase